MASTLQGRYSEGPRINRIPSLTMVLLLLLYGGLHFCPPWPIQISYISFEIAPVVPINRQVRAITWRLWGCGCFLVGGMAWIHLGISEHPIPQPYGL